MADLNGANGTERNPTELGTLVYADNSAIAVNDSVGLLSSFSIFQETPGEDTTDAFSFIPQNVTSVSLDFIGTGSGDYANLVYILPVSGVTKITGDISGSWFGGIHTQSTTPFRQSATETAQEISNIFPSLLPNVDTSGLTSQTGSRDAATAIWELDGSPVIFIVQGSEFRGDITNNPYQTINAYDVNYLITFTPETGTEPEPIVIPEPSEVSIEPEPAPPAPEPEVISLPADAPAPVFSRYENDPDRIQRFVGDEGMDVFAFGNSRANLTFDKIGEDQIVIRPAPGQNTNDILIDFDRIELTDGHIAFDTDGNAGQAYRLYQAAFDRTPDAEGLGYWIDTFDAGQVTLVEMAEYFIQSTEFAERYAPPGTLSDADFLTLLYQNVLDRTPDQEGFAYWEDQQQDGLSRAEILQYFSESTENYNNVAGEIDMGIFYL